jgi:predicted ester cyclase
MGGGPNSASLIEAQANFREFGACEARLTAYTRPPRDDDAIEPGWRPIDEQRDHFESVESSTRPDWPKDETVLYWWRPTYWRLSETMEDRDLLAVYRDYLACLNERRWDALARYVDDEVVYNGERVGLSGYRAMLEDDVEAIPDLRFVPKILLADEHVVSCRLFFECTPARTFLSFEPTGGRVSFSEHVFYAFREGRIAEVWSVIDREAIRRQLS